MEILSEIGINNKLLNKYKGGKLKIALYDESLKRMALRLESNNYEEVIYIIGIGCERIVGNFECSNVQCNIKISTINLNGENLYEFCDKLSDFKILASSGFTLAKGLNSEFGSNFESFLRK